MFNRTYHMDKTAYEKCGQDLVGGLLKALKNCIQSSCLRKSSAPSLYGREGALVSYSEFNAAFYSLSKSAIVYSGCRAQPELNNAGNKLLQFQCRNCWLTILLTLTAPDAGWKSSVIRTCNTSDRIHKRLQ